MHPALLHLLQENLTNPTRLQMQRKRLTHKQRCSPNVPDEHGAIISTDSLRKTEKKALRRPPFTPSHQALPVPQKRPITAQPVAELYVLSIYLFICFLFVCVSWKASQLAQDEAPQCFKSISPPFFSVLFLFSLSSPQGCWLSIYAQCVSSWSSSFKKQSSLAEPAPNLDTKSILGKTLWRITNVISAATLLGAIPVRRPKNRCMLGYGKRMQCDLSGKLDLLEFSSQLIHWSTQRKTWNSIYLNVCHANDVWHSAI